MRRRISALIEFYEKKDRKSKDLSVLIMEGLNVSWILESERDRREKRYKSKKIFYRETNQINLKNIRE